MASSTPPNVSECLDNVIECPICREICSDPRALPCLHTFCFMCIAKWGRDKLPGDGLECPLCRKEFVIPESGLACLPKNFFMEQLKRMKQVSGESGSSAGTQRESASSEDADDELTLERRDADCRKEATKKPWRDSGQNYRSSPDTVAVAHRTAVSQKAPPLERENVMCATHSEKHQDMFCRDCKQILCVICFIDQHASHDCTYVDKAADEARTQMKSDTVVMAAVVSNCDEFLKKIRQDQDEFLAETEVTANRVRATTETLKNAIDIDSYELLRHLDDIKQSRLRRFAEAAHLVRQHRLAVENMRASVELLAARGSTIEVARKGDAMHTGSEQLLSSDAVQSAARDLRFGKVTFEPSEHLTGKGTSNVVGVISTNVTKEGPSLASGETKLNTIQTDIGSTQVLHVIPGGSVVVGITCLDDQLYVLRCPSGGHVELYDGVSFGLVRQLAVPELGNLATGLASGPASGSLYISDFDNQFVHRIPTSKPRKLLKAMLAGVTKAVPRWPVVRPSGISVSKNGGVLVTSWTRPCEILMFTSNGSLLWKLPLGADITDPSGAIMLPDGRIAITSGQCRQSGGSVGPHRVCLIDVVNGAVVQSYGSESPGSGHGELNTPTGIAYHDSGHWLVADKYNDRILVLNSSFGSVRQLAVNVEGGLHRPNAIYVDAARNRLYIGESAPGRVLVVTLQKRDFQYRNCRSLVK